MLTKDMIHLIETYTIGCVATVRPDGAPAVSPKATFLVLDDRTIAFANIRSPGTVENVRRHPEVEVNFLDVFARTGCRVRGCAHYLSRDEVEASLQTRFRDKWPELYGLIQGFVIIDVTEAQALSSPAYDIGGVAGQLTEHWLRRYATALGFAVTKRTDRNPVGTSSRRGGHL